MALGLLGGVLGGGGGGGGGGLAGGAIGGSLGAVGGVLGSIAQQKEARQSFKDVQQGMKVGTAETARQTAAALGSREFQQYSNFIRGMFGIAPQTQQEMQHQFAGTFDPTSMYGLGVSGYGDTTKLNYKESGQLSGHSRGAYNKQYIEGIMGAPMDPATAQMGNGPASVDFGNGYDPFSPLANEFKTKLGSAQAARGLYSSQAAASAEGSGLAALKTNMQMQLLPQLLGLATAPTDLANRYRDTNMQRAVYGRTGGATTYGVTNPGLVANGGGILGTLAAGLNSGAAGFGAGAQVGSALQGQSQQANFNQQYLDILRGGGGGGLGGGGMFGNSGQPYNSSMG